MPSHRQPLSLASLDTLCPQDALDILRGRYMRAVYVNAEEARMLEAAIAALCSANRGLVQ